MHRTAHETYHLRQDIRKFLSCPSTMTPWVSFTAGLRRIARRRRPNLLRSRARRPRHRRRLRRGKRPARHAPTPTGQDGARPSASKSARLARSAPARNEKPASLTKMWPLSAIRTDGPAQHTLTPLMVRRVFAYDRFMAPQLFEPWAREMVGRAKLRSGSSVLDVASGPAPLGPVGSGRRA